MEKSSNSSLISKSIITYIFIILFIICYSRILTDGAAFNFTSFLHMMETVPDITLPTRVVVSIGGSWGFFEFLRTFFNSWIAIINFGLYYSSLALNNLIVVLWFVGFFLGYGV